MEPERAAELDSRLDELVRERYFVYTTHAPMCTRGSLISSDCICREHDHDMELVVGELVSILGQSSKTFKVLKLVHQNVILYCVSILKESICSGILTKDVRTPNGWRVGIEIKENIQVRIVPHTFSQPSSLTFVFRPWSTEIGLARPARTVRGYVG